METLRTEVLLPRGTPLENDWFSQMVYDLEDQIDPPGRSDADEDFAKWGSWGNGFKMRQATNRILREWLPPGGTSSSVRRGIKAAFACLPSNRRYRIFD